MLTRRAAILGAVTASAAVAVPALPAGRSPAQAAEYHARELTRIMNELHPGRWRHHVDADQGFVLVDRQMAD